MYIKAEIENNTLLLSQTEQCNILTLYPPNTFIQRTLIYKDVRKDETIYCKYSPVTWNRILNRQYKQEKKP